MPHQYLRTCSVAGRVLGGPCGAGTASEAKGLTGHGPQILGRGAPGHNRDSSALQHGREAESL